MFLNLYIQRSNQVSIPKFMKFDAKDVSNVKSAAYTCFQKWIEYKILELKYGNIV